MPIHKIDATLNTMPKIILCVIKQNIVNPIRITGDANATNSKTT